MKILVKVRKWYTYHLYVDESFKEKNKIYLFATVLREGLGFFWVCLLDYSSLSCIRNTRYVSQWISSIAVFRVRIFGGKKNL